MSRKALEEFSGAELQQEFRRRELFRRMGRCPYCNKKLSEQVCKHPAQHRREERHEAT